MREVHVDTLQAVIEKLFIDANYDLPEEVLKQFRDSREKEESSVGKEVFEELLLNAKIAGDERIPICQDTGLAILFLEIGQDVHVIGGNLEQAVSEGVRQAYKKGLPEKVGL